MQLQLSRSDQKILLIAGAMFVALVIVALLLASPESGQETTPTTYSSDSSGAKAAYLLLQETGYHVERWERSLAEIETGDNAALILAEPERYANERERARLRRFVREGGRLIAIGQSAGPMLPENPSVAGLLEEAVWQKYTAMAPSPITRAAPEITMAPRAQWTSHKSGLALYGRGEQTAVVTYPYGRGRVLWWASATPLTNAGLKEPGNLEFFLACLGDKATTRIYWDEYMHGYSRSRKASYEINLIGGILAQFVLLSAAVLWTFSRRSGPVRPADPEVRLSPLEFAETLGGLYEHAHASAVAVDICYQRFLYWLTKRLGMSGSASVEEFERAVRSRWSFHDEQFAPVLRECASARYLPDLQPKRALQLVRSLHSYAVQLRLFPTSAKESN
jgi:hypothetical protein